jgi:hypothetical protein
MGQTDGNSAGGRPGLEQPDAGREPSALRELVEQLERAILASQALIAELDACVGFRQAPHAG